MTKTRHYHEVSSDIANHGVAAVYNKIKEYQDKVPGDAEISFGYRYDTEMDAAVCIIKFFWKEEV